MKDGKKKPAKQLSRKDLKKTRGGSGEALGPASPRGGTSDLTAISNIMKKFADESQAIINNLKA